MENRNPILQQRNRRQKKAFPSRLPAAACGTPAPPGGFADPPALALHERLRLHGSRQTKVGAWGKHSGPEGGKTSEGQQSLTTSQRNRTLASSAPHDSEIPTIYNSPISHVSFFSSARPSPAVTGLCPLPPDFKLQIPRAFVLTNPQKARESLS